MTSGKRFAGFWTVGNVNLKVVPFPGNDSIHILPPFSSMIFLTIESPIPVLSEMFLSWMAWKISNIFSWYSGAMPGPLSSTEILIFVFDKNLKNKKFILLFLFFKKELSFNFLLRIENP